MIESKKCNFTGNLFGVVATSKLPTHGKERSSADESPRSCGNCCWIERRFVFKRSSKLLPVVFDSSRMYAARTVFATSAASALLTDRPALVSRASATSMLHFIHSSNSASKISPFMFGLGRQSFKCLSLACNFDLIEFFWDNQLSQYIKPECYVSL